MHMGLVYSGKNRKLYATPQNFSWCFNSKEALRLVIFLILCISMTLQNVFVSSSTLFLEYFEVLKKLLLSSIPFLQTISLNFILLTKPPYALSLVSTKMFKILLKYNTHTNTKIDSLFAKLKKKCNVKGKEVIKSCQCTSFLARATKLPRNTHPK